MRLVFAIPGLSTDANSAEGKLVRKMVNKYLPRIGKVTYGFDALTFKVKGAFGLHSSAIKNAKALEALLMLLTEINCYYLRTRPPVAPLYNAGVYYSRTTVWDSIPALYMRGYGDCKSLTAARVAELLTHGYSRVRPVFRFDRNRRGTMFHILVMYPDGSPEDPSKILGMRAPQELAS